MGAQAPELSYAQPLFLEEQRPWEMLDKGGRAIVWVPAGYAIGSLIFGIVARHRLSSPLVFFFIFGVPLLVFGAIALGSKLVATTIVELSAIQVRFSLGSLTIWRRTVPTGQIQFVELQQVQFETPFASIKQTITIWIENERISLGSARPYQLLDSIRIVRSQSVGDSKRVEPIFVFDSLTSHHDCS